MSQEILDNIKKNSGININETSTSNDISRTQKILSHLIDEKYNNSLMYSVCEVIKMKGTWGTFFTTFRKPGTTNFEIIKKDIYTQNITIPTGFTIEVWQDVLNMYKSNSYKKAAGLLRGVSDDQENFYLIDYIRNNSNTASELIVNSNNTGWITSQISSKVAEIVLEMNNKSFKTLDSFCILSPKWARYFLGTASFVMGENKNNTSTYFVGRYGKTDFYVNPIPTARSQFNNDFNNNYADDPNAQDDYCYVGLKSEETGLSSLIFAPYQYEMQDVQDPDSGKQNLFLYNRFGLAENPQSDLPTGKKLLYKFKIQ